LREGRHRFIVLGEAGEEARRQLTICNACRYCEGYCAVFPALERRREFEDRDVEYLSHLCHDCRACYYACMYAPPHVFAVNIPLTLAAVRERTHGTCGWPRGLAGRVGTSAGWMLGAGLGAGLLIGGAIALWPPGHSIWRSVRGAGAFYQVIPYAVLVSVFLGLGIAALGLMLRSGVEFWKRIADRLRPGTGIRGLAQVTIDAVRARYLGGGGEGCFYPEDRPSRLRQIAHVLVVAGFVCDLAATISAAVAQDLLGQLPPYAIASVPVCLGVGGGAMLLVGTSLLICFKRLSDPRPADVGAVATGYGLLASLELVVVSGFLLLLLRDTKLMIPLLALHLGAVAVFFCVAPYGKLMHVAFRYLALVRWRQEARGR
jgi:citrate/tricarballylate utilization protein